GSAADELRTGWRSGDGRVDGQAGLRAVAGAGSVADLEEVAADVEVGGADGHHGGALVGVGLGREGGVDVAGLGVEGGQVAVGVAVGAADPEVPVGRLGRVGGEAGILGVGDLVVVVADQVH